MSDLVTIIEQNSIGQITQITDPKVNTTDFSYDDYSRLELINYPDGGETRFKYGDTNGSVPDNSTIIEQKVEDGASPRFIKTQIDTDEFFNLKKVINLTDHITTEISHDDLQRINKIERETGADISFEHDPLNRITKINDLRNGVTEVTYDDMVKYRNIDNAWVISKSKTVVNPVGDKTIFYYDIFSRLIIKQKTVEANGVQKDVFWKYKWDKRGRLTEERNPVQRITRYHYDDLNRLKQKEVVNWIKEFFDYNKLHQLKKYIDPRGNATNFEFDKFDRLNAIMRPLKDLIVLGYDDNGNINNINHNGRITERDHDEINNLIEIIDAEQNKTQFGYDLIQRLISITDPYDNTKKWHFDSRNNLLSFTDEETNSSLFTYNRDNGLETSVEPRGPSTQKIYTTDHAGDIATVTNARHDRTDYIRDKLGRIRTIRIHALNLDFHIDYNSFNKISDITFPDGSQWEYNYDEIGRLKQIKSPEGRTNNFLFDILNRIRVNHKGINLDKWVYFYDQNNNLVRVVNPLGGAIENTYDKLNRVKTITPFGRAPITCDYDYNYKLMNVVDSNGNLIEYEFDRNGLLIKVTDQEDKKTLLRYDKNKRLELFGLEDPNGQYLESYDYYPTGRLKNIFFKDGSNINFEYDKNGNIEKVTDEEDLVTTYFYRDIFNLPTEITPPDQVQERIKYDAIGRPTEIKSGSTLDITYNDIRRTTLLKAASGRKVKLYHTEDGNLKKLVKYYCCLWPFFSNISTTTFRYDHTNRILKVKNALSNLVTYHYNGLGQLEGFDVNGNPTQEIIDFNKDGTINTVEDANGTRTHKYNPTNGRLEQIIFNDGRLIDYEYYKNGLVEKVIHSSGLKKVYDYDHSKNVFEIIEGLKRIILTRDERLRVFKEEIQPDNEINLIKYYNNGVIKQIGNIGYLHNNKGQLEAVQLGPLRLEYDYYDNGWLKKLSTTQGYFREFGYDPDGRVKEVKTPRKIFFVKYDTFGNPKSVIMREGWVVERNNYVYDNAGQLLFINQGTPQEISYDYDERGNLRFENDMADATVSGKSFDWSNHLRMINNNGIISDLKYDSKGNLVGIERSDGTKTEYKYDDANRLRTVLRDDVRVEELEYDSLDRLVLDKISGTDRLLKHVGIYPISITEDGLKQEVIPDKDHAWPIAFVKNNDIFIPTWLLGNSVIHHNETGEVKGKQARLPYGDKETGDIDQNPFGFKGYYRFLDEDLRWAVTRNYSPDIKHFLSSDILRGNPFKPITMNRRRIFSNNPLKYLDFLGLQDEDVIDLTAETEGMYETVVTTSGDDDTCSVCNFEEDVITGDAGEDNRPWLGEEGSSLFGGGGGVRQATPDEIKMLSNMANVANEISDVVQNFGNLNNQPPKLYLTPMGAMKLPLNTPTKATPPESPQPVTQAQNFGKSLEDYIEKMQNPYDFSRYEEPSTDSGRFVYSTSHYDLERTIIAKLKNNPIIGDFISEMERSGVNIVFSPEHWLSQHGVTAAHYNPKKNKILIFYHPIRTSGNIRSLGGISPGRELEAAIAHELGHMAYALRMGKQPEKGGPSDAWAVFFENAIRYPHQPRLFHGPKLY